MSFGVVTAWTLLRAAAIAGLAIFLAKPLAEMLRGLAPPWRRAVWLLLLLPALTPPILTGYVLARGRFAGGTGTSSAEWIYAVVLLLKLVPIATLVLHLLPTPLTREGAHAFALLHRSWWARQRFSWSAAGRAPGISLAIIFLLAFSDFELAAMWNARSWTVSLFDAHAGGLPLRDSLRLIAWPLGVEALVLGALVFDGRAIFGTGNNLSSPPERRPSSGLLIYLVSAALIVTLFPMASVLVRGASGFSTLLQTFSLGTDLLASVAFALSSSGAAFWIARGLVGKKTPLSSGRNPWFQRFPWKAICCLPGLLGALVLSLGMVTLFQSAPLRPAYDTMLPLWLALTLLLLPLALLLRFLLNASRPREAIFLADQLRRPELLWQLQGRRAFLAWALLFCWAYFDFTAASILAPVGFTPVFVRLHNLMHYGQNAVLSAMVCAALATPLAVLLLTSAAARLYARHHGR